jgi:uncharacterized protein (TIGR03435 family)
MQTSTESVGGQLFEAASIKRSTLSTPRWTITPGRLYCPSANLLALVARAFSLQLFQIKDSAGSPEEHWEVTATTKAGATRAEVLKMLRALLIERFDLKFHYQSDRMRIYVLEPTAHGMHLVESSTDSPLTLTGVSGGGVRLSGKVSLATLAAALSARLRVPVLDETGADKVYDIAFDWIPSEEEAGLKNRSGTPSPETTALQVGANFI